jgi:hypothetical protein
MRAAHPIRPPLLVSGRTVAEVVGQQADGEINQAGEVGEPFKSASSALLEQIFRNTFGVAKALWRYAGHVRLLPGTASRVSSGSSASPASPASALASWPAAGWLWQRAAWDRLVVATGRQEGSRGGANLA